MKYLDFNSKKLHRTFSSLSKKGFITKNRRGLLYKITFIKTDDLPYETINLNITHPAVSGFYNTLWLLRDKDNVFCIPFNLAFKYNQHAAKTMLKEFIKQKTIRKISRHCIQFCIS
ncbi:MAG TPA: hypothetical protein ENO30_05610 [Thermodesulfobium narugense]|nr:hypothetical protein [Thermodesulfobium narugense]